MYDGADVPDPPDLLEVAARQMGFVTRLDARTAGWTTAALRHRVARGDWIAHGRRVLHRAGVPWSRASPLMRAVLDAGPGAVVSHTTAAAWWGLPGFDTTPIHVTRPRGMTSQRPRYADHVHAVLALGSDQVTVLDGLPIVRPERAVFELCGLVHPARAERALDAGWSRALYSGASLRRVHAELAERGRPGRCCCGPCSTPAHAWRGPASVQPGGPLHDHRPGGRARRVASPGRRRGGRLVRCVDFLAVDSPLVVEVQSERYHVVLTDRAHDDARRAAIEAAGFVVVEVWDRQLWHARHEVVAAVREGRLRATFRRAA